MFDDQTPTSPPPPYSAVPNSPADSAPSSSSHFTTEPPQTSTAQASAPDLSKLPLPDDVPSFAPQPQYQTFALPSSSSPEEPQDYQQQSSSSTAPAYPGTSNDSGAGSCSSRGGFFGTFFGGGGSKRYPMMRNPWGRCPGRPKKFRALTRRLCLFLSLLFGILLYSFVLSSIGGVRDDAYWVTLPHVIRADVGDEVKITLDGWNSKVQLTEGKEDYPTIRIHATPSDFAKQTKFKTIKSGSQTEVQVEVPSRWKFWSNEAIVEVQAPRNGIRLVSNKKVELRAPSVRHIDVFGDYAQIVQPSDAEWHGESLKLETKYSAIHLMGKRVQATTSIQLRSKDASTKLETKTVDTPVLQATTSNAYLDVSSHLICNTVDLVASNAYISLSNTVDAPRVSLKTSNAQITASGQIHAEDLLVKTSNARVELKHARILRHVEARTSNANIRANLAGSASDVVSIFTTSNANMDISVPTSFVGSFDLKTSSSPARIETHEPQAVRFSIDEEYHKQGVYHKAGGGSIQAATSNAGASLAFTAA